MTLTQAASLTRKSIVFAVIFSVLGTLSLVGYRAWYAHYLSTLPPVEEKADAKFGVLPLPNFPLSDASSSNYSYSLDTVTGNLPEFDKLVKVFFIPKPYTSLLAGEKSQELAKNFEIQTPPEIISETRYRYGQEDQTLIVDLDAENFHYTKSSTPSASLALGEDNKLIADFKGFLGAKKLLPESLKNGRAKIDYSKIEEVSVAQINLWPQDFDGKPIVTAQLDKGLVRAMISGSPRDLDSYLSLSYTFWTIDPTTFATYPLKNTLQAFDDLKQGKGVVLKRPTGAQNVSITNVYLGYFQSENYTPYLQPIFVFEGPQFMALVTAIVEQFQH